MHLLDISNFKIISASNGKEGLELARSIIPDIILLDLMLPGLNGFEVLKALKKDPETVAIPVIILTGRDDYQARERVEKLYEEAYMVKPVDAHELKAKIKEILNIK